jgi:hypothetical protein
VRQRASHRSRDRAWIPARFPNNNKHPTMLRAILEITQVCLHRELERSLAITVIMARDFVPLHITDSLNYVQITSGQLERGRGAWCHMSGLLAVLGLGVRPSRARLRSVCDVNILFYWSECKCHGPRAASACAAAGA